MDLTENDTPRPFCRRIRHDDTVGDNPCILKYLIDPSSNRSPVSDRLFAGFNNVSLETPRNVTEATGRLETFGVYQTRWNPILLDEIHVPVG